MNIRALCYSAVLVFTIQNATLLFFLRVGKEAGGSEKKKTGKKFTLLDNTETLNLAQECPNSVEFT